MDKRKLIGMILGVTFFALMITGFTVAFYVWTSGKMSYTVDSTCFNVFYEKGNDITGVMMPSTDYTKGLFTTVKMDIDSGCAIDANGILYINTLDTTSSNLYRTGLLNYQVLKEGEVVSNGNGSITGSGEIAINLGELSKNESANTSYTVYVWVDNNLVENSDVNSVYNGNIRVEAVQFEK